MTKWGSFNGKTHTVETMDHQHISNIVWYYKLLVSATRRESTLNLIMSEIQRRFDGEVLPYKPMDSFKMEIDALRRKGYIQNNGLNEDIVVDGEKIGQVIKGTKPQNGFSFV
jgi:hypothetical protein